MKVVTLTCSDCGRKFERTDTDYRRGLRRGHRNFYCSLSCANAARGKGEQGIPWLRPRTKEEEWLAEMIAGAAMEFRRTFEGEDASPDIGGMEYWSGYWAALIDYGRRVFQVQSYHGSKTHED